MTHVEDSTDKELYRFENYYDNAAGVYYKDGGKQSIVSFTEVKSMNDKEYFEVDLSGDRIVFRLSSKMYKHYTKVCNKNEESIVRNQYKVEEK